MKIQQDHNPASGITRDGRDAGAGVCGQRDAQVSTYEWMRPWAERRAMEMLQTANRERVVA